MATYRIYTNLGERLIIASDADEAARIFAEAEDLPEGIVDLATLIESIEDVGGWVGVDTLDGAALTERK